MRTRERSFIVRSPELARSPELFLNPIIRVTISTIFCAALALQAVPLNYSVSWLGNSFSGASNRWVQNFFIHVHVQPDGTVNTWSHWDEGGKKFGVYKDGDVAMRAPF